MSEIYNQGLEESDIVPISETKIGYSPNEAI
jgi:hypothetical protein